MADRWIADAILVTHFCFVAFVLFGGIVVVVRRWVAWLHIPAVLWAAVINVAGWTCPLTPLETAYRLHAGQAGYAGGFVEHYLMPLVYPDSPGPYLGLLLGVGALVWNGAIYCWVVRRISHHA